MNLIEAICRGLHVLAAVCWIGGLYLLIRVIRPIMLSGESADKNYALLRQIQGKFRSIAGMMLLTLLITGMGNVFFVIQRYQGTPPPMSYMMLLGVKILLAFGLFGIYLLNVSAASTQHTKIAENPSAPQPAPGFVMPVQALVLGLVIIFIGVILHTSLIH